MPSLSFRFDAPPADVAADKALAAGDDGKLQRVDATQRTLTIPSGLTYKYATPIKAGTGGAVVSAAPGVTLAGSSGGTVTLAGPGLVLLVQNGADDFDLYLCPRLAAD